MASNYWVKLHHHILDDRRFVHLPKRAAWHWVLCFAYAGELREHGLLGTTEDLAWRLRVPEHELANDLDAMHDAGLLTQDEAGIWAVVDFAKSQAAETSAERKRQQRKRKKEAKWFSASVLKHPRSNGNSDPVTACVTNRDTDKDKDKDEDEDEDRETRRKRYLGYINDRQD